MNDRILFLTSVEEDGSLSRPALETLSAVQELASRGGVEFDAAFTGKQVQKAADAAAGCGAVMFYGVEGDDFAAARYASDAAAAEAAVKAADASLILAPANSRWSRVIPGLAQRLGGQADTFAAKIEPSESGPPVLTRWYYRQRLMAKLTRERRPWLITIAPGSYPPAQSAPGTAAVEKLQVNLLAGAKRTTVTGIKASAAGEQTIRPEAGLLFVAGAGWTKKQADGQTHIKKAEKLILDFINASQASLGSSKSMVDLAAEGQAALPFMTHLHQIGQTGATPRHPKGLAACCHGEEPHVVGWRFIRERRAVNLDPNCGWAQGKADVLYVADAFAVIERVNQLLSAL